MSYYQALRPYMTSWKDEARALGHTYLLLLTSVTPAEQVEVTPFDIAEGLRFLDRQEGKVLTCIYKGTKLLEIRHLTRHYAQGLLLGSRGKLQLQVDGKWIHSLQSLQPCGNRLYPPEAGKGIETVYSSYLYVLIYTLRQLQWKVYAGYNYYHPDFVLGYNAGNNSSN